MASMALMHLSSFSRTAGGKGLCSQAADERSVKQRCSKRATCERARYVEGVHARMLHAYQLLHLLHHHSQLRIVQRGPAGHGAAWNLPGRRQSLHARIAGGRVVNGCPGEQGMGRCAMRMRPCTHLEPQLLGGSAEPASNGVRGCRRRSAAALWAYGPVTRATGGAERSDRIEDLAWPTCVPAGPSGLCMSCCMLLRSGCCCNQSSCWRAFFQSLSIELRASGLSLGWEDRIEGF
jgi:hypothetical protein